MPEAIWARNPEVGLSSLKNLVMAQIGVAEFAHFAGVPPDEEALVFFDPLKHVHTPSFGTIRRHQTEEPYLAQKIAIVLVVIG
jgi:hypothetical protein